MELSIKNGTTPDGPSLCESCSHSHIVRGCQESELIVICQLMYPERGIPFRVRHCSEYAEKGTLSLKQMEDVAWPIASGGYKRQAGFQPPRSVPVDQPEEEEEDRESEVFVPARSRQPREPAGRRRLLARR